MTTVNNSPINGLYWPEGTKTPEVDDGSLDQEDFFALMSAQLAMQDPTAPTDNDQMIAQMASFATVDGIESLNEEIQSLNSVMSSSQALQASTLVGQKVLIPSNIGYLSDSDTHLAGVVSAPTGTQNVVIRVEDSSGQLVRSIEVDASAGGNVDFQWDGKDESGNLLPEDQYTFSAQGLADGVNQELPVSTYAHVSSVSLGGSDYATILNLKGLGGISLGDVLAVADV